MPAGCEEDPGSPRPWSSESLERWPFKHPIDNSLDIAFQSPFWLPKHLLRRYAENMRPFQLVPTNSGNPLSPSWSSRWHQHGGSVVWRCRSDFRCTEVLFCLVITRRKTGQNTSEWKIQCQPNIRRGFDVPISSSSHTVAPWARTLGTGRGHVSDVCHASHAGTHVALGSRHSFIIQTEQLYLSSYRRR